MAGFDWLLIIAGLGAFMTMLVIVMIINDAIKHSYRGGHDENHT